MKKGLQQVFEEFLFECEFVKKTKPKTLRSYTQIFSLFMKMTPNASIQTIQTSTVVHFFRQLQERKRIVGKGVSKIGVKKSTIATYWTKLNCFFQWLVSKGHLESNPFAGLPYPTPSYDDRKYLTKEDVERILTAIHCHHDNNLLILKRNLVILHVLLFCGLRREELLMLQVRDIDFERKLLTIRGIHSKSGFTRQVPLHSSCMLYLKDYLTERKKYSTPYLLVSSSSDDRLSTHGLKHLVIKLNQCSGISFHLHQFRHTFAVNFLKTSNNVAKLKQLLGHRSIQMTLTYLRCLPTDELRGDIEAMNIDNLL